MGTLIDYAEFLLDIRKNLKDFEDCMLERKFKEAQLYAESALVEARLLCLIAKEKVE
jgi:hypothetical protein